MFGIIISIVYLFTMLGNSLCILNEERFLNHIGVNSKSRHPIPKQLAELIRTIKTLFTIPLCISNLLFIMYEILLG
ncbi:hypothetical protein NEDG_01890 [Nematocida displodere]|uniref:Protein transport protein YOS1 n=1 Tax=Nematocida displodere TaxID=1805483 RepID=A0A177EHD3_9MICR|nr:hypothetical protein NEDG_01890 [Nematocida displodere]